MHAKFEIFSPSRFGGTRGVPQFKSRSPEKGEISGGSVHWRVFTAGPANEPKEEKWPQPADPVLLSRTESQTSQPDLILPPSPKQNLENQTTDINGGSCSTIWL